MIRKYWRCLLWVVASNVITTSSVLALDFYHARVAVENQSSAQRNKAAGEGLRQVLVRVSGTLDIERSPDVLNALSKAANYIDQYQYEVDRDQWGDKQEYLSMFFSASVVEQFLRRASLPFWPINRPKILVWLVEDHSEAGKQLVNDPKSAVLKSLMAAADRRGLPLSLPLLDLDDQLAMPATSLWELNEPVILAASERYGVDTVLVGRYTQTSTGQWWATWQFFHRGDSRMIDLRVDQVAEMGMPAISPLADYLASLYAIVPNVESSPQVVMQIDGIASFGDYRGIMNYLRNLAAVTSFNLVLLADHHILLTLQLNGDLGQFNNVISLDQKLQDEATQVSPDAPWISVPRGTLDHPLRYQWVGR